MKKSLLALALLALAGCGKKTDYAYHSNPPARQFFESTFSIQEIDTRNKIDILWVIDNSGSMSDIQNNIIDNSELFMKEFIKSNYIDWNMGLVSTSKDEQPYLGFSTPFNRSNIDPVTTFKNSVARLGTDGNSQETPFASIDYAFKRPLPFLRSNSHLAVIIVTDELEQSTDLDAARYEVNNFLTLVRGMIYTQFKVRFYGAIDARELENCDSYAMEYAGSPFEKIVTMTNGFTMSACNTDFGIGLSSIGKDIASMLEYPRLLLSKKPKVETIKVLYKGTELPPGRPERGGYWYYDDEFNMIVFYNLNFSQDFQFDSVDVSFQVNDGYR